MGEKFDLSEMLKEIEADKNLKGPDAGRLSQQEITRRFGNKEEIKALDQDRRE